MLKVSSHSSNQNVVSFKNNDKTTAKQNLSPSEPYKTSAGIKTATGHAVVGLGVFYGLQKYFNNLMKKCNDLPFGDGLQNVTKNLGKARIKTSIVARFLVTTLGCGLIADKLINKKREKLAHDLKTKDVDTLMKEDKHIEKTEKGNPYYKSKVYQNIGPLLGIGVFALNSAINLGVSIKKGLPVKVKGMDILDGLCTVAFGGMILGAITDKFSNKAAKAHADKQS